MKMPLSIYNPYPSALDWDQCASRANMFFTRTQRFREELPYTTIPNRRLHLFCYPLCLSSCVCFKYLSCKKDASTRARRIVWHYICTKASKSRGDSASTTCSHVVDKVDRGSQTNALGNHHGDHGTANMIDGNHEALIGLILDTLDDIDRQ